MSYPASNMDLFAILGPNTFGFYTNPEIHNKQPTLVACSSKLMPYEVIAKTCYSNDSKEMVDRDDATLRPVFSDAGGYCVIGYTDSTTGDIRTSLLFKLSYWKSMPFLTTYPNAYAVIATYTHKKTFTSEDLTHREAFV